jgi:hypothetical protein
MKRVLFGAVIMGAVFALTSFAIRDAAGTATRSRGGPAWKVSEYQLDRAFRYQIPLSGTPTNFVAPPTGGIIITQVRRALGGGHVSITVDGLLETFQFPNQNPGPEDVYDLNPPIIVRPGETLSIWAPLGTPEVSIAGYETHVGET